ncbi:MAG: cell division protein FtsK, partial [Lentisphaeria bacterium]|nr:cell division protein FtsK [Lentisphaeria bacterium]
DIQKVVEFVSEQMPQQFNEAVLTEEKPAGEDGNKDPDDDDGDVPWDDGKPDIKTIVRKYLRPGDGDVMRQALEVVFLEGKASTSYFQRRLGIGYNRAAELVDQLEERGVLGPPSGSGNKREILVFDTLDVND